MKYVPHPTNVFPPHLLKHIYLPVCSLSATLGTSAGFVHVCVCLHVCIYVLIHFSCT